MADATASLVLHWDAMVCHRVTQALMDDLMVDGAFSSQLSNGSAQLSAPVASMPHIGVEGASSQSTSPMAEALGRIF